ncbi:type III-A CRISPR-associated protein Csm2 [Chromatium okenii]|jgi:CRISPR-associated protein Csm2|uniref:type III-A CRISPR-associated protein Csm2 n=1 Tax=Chromatium okenii TaxID=61644 RepID=UPI0026F118EF|nr:type III-A CRISPR-associated protein Csm2 [Chromatium okenii]MBV5310885.1 type III-A CRISPR-associated protein Csm2 [Chromatium okenii]
MAEGRYPSQRDTRRPGGDRQNPRDAYVPDIILDGIQFGNQLDPQLFNEIAKRCAVTIGDNQRRNKPSQLRRFYDELVMWAEKTKQHPERFEEYRPFILMLNAKAAYADGRELVDGNFVKLLDHCLRQAVDARTLGYIKLFLEAFLGFYKEVRPRES